MNMRIAIVLTLVLFITNQIDAQNSLKLDKQKNTFIYATLNLHTGLAQKSEDTEFGMTNNISPSSFSLQMLKKNRKFLLKGYTPGINLQSTKIRFSVSCNHFNYDTNEKATFVKLNLVDASLKFATKWDRTSLRVGYMGIPYGHNPKIDPISSFTTNIAGMDLGFTRDIGLLIKTPISKNLDLEVTATSGGWIGGNVSTYEIYTAEDLTTTKDIKLADFNYNNTWLLSGRIGRPTYNKHEFGGILISGSLNDVMADGDKSFITRIGGDWVYKHKEKFKTSHQVTWGTSDSDIAGLHHGFYIQNNIDLFLNSKFILNFSHASKLLKNTNDGSNYRDSRFTSSLTYAFLPHVRLRLNEYYNHNSTDKGNYGLLLQLVVGLGQKG